MTADGAPQQPLVPYDVEILFEKFGDNITEITKHYKEANIRQEFIDEFFRMLGWDVSNRKNAPPSYREVVIEETLDVEDEHDVRKRRPDYSFRAGGATRFFVEAKALEGKNLKFDHKGARQLRTYAWSARLPVSILTNFEYFTVYDTRYRPRNEDQADVAVIAQFHWSQTSELWQYFSENFSREAVLAGALDKFVKGLRQRRGAIPVDAAFLDDIERWRKALAVDIARRNTLTVHQLNFAVQRTLDRIIFFRIAEDRDLESYGTLARVADEAITGQNRAYGRLMTEFLRLDERFNSGLFHFDADSGRSEDVDQLTPTLKVGDAVLREIISHLYYPTSPYRFSVMPPEILGQVYEQFLGKVITMPQSHEAVVVEKPEVRKAGGVYYTPSYIVKEIVRTTLDPLVKGKTPEDVASIKIIDPACGSGSFLIEVYQYLLDWHLDWYDKHRSRRLKGPSPVYEDASGNLRLTPAERKRILLTCIHGVDIDEQAVEVTKLSLCLRVLEGETGATLNAQQKLGIPALPDLGANIKCGNSLIDSSLYDAVDTSAMDREIVARLNPFDWNQQFKSIFNRPVAGFDAIVGNPPYIRIQTLNQVVDIESDYYKGRYKTAAEGNYDIYGVFVERSLELLRPQGRLGFILPHKFFNAKYGRPLRTLLADASALSRIVHFGDEQVFEGASTYTCLLFLDKAGPKDFTFIKASDLDAWRTQRLGIEGKIRAKAVSGDEWNFVVGEGRNLFDRLREIPLKLSDPKVTDRIFRGGQTSADAVFILDLIAEEKKTLTVRSPQTEKTYSLDKRVLKPLVKGGQLKRYSIAPHEKVLLFPYKVESSKATLMTEDELSRFVGVIDYLVECRSVLTGRKGTTAWYSYGFPKALTLFEQPKIVTPDFSPHAAFSYDRDGKYYFPGGAAGGYGILPAVGIDPLFLLGLLNSRLMEWFNRQSATSMRGGWYSYESRFISHWPVRLPETSGEEAIADKLAALADALIKGHAELREMPPGHDRTVLFRHVQGLEKQADRIVYELYGLSEEEISLVEVETSR